MKKNLGSLLIILISFIFFIFLSPHKQPTTPTPNPISSPKATPFAKGNQVLGVRTKNTGCLAKDGLQDIDCTPGANIQGITKDQICVSGYAKSVRNVPESEKDQVYAEYGITSHQTGEFEVDHLISLELGGSNDITNLWPEAAEPKPGFHEKDKVENYLHKQLCNGSIGLEQAQQEISTNWLEVYKEISP